jgi:hypothetical protein
MKKGPDQRAHSHQTRESTPVTSASTNDTMPTPTPTPTAEAAFDMTLLEFNVCVDKWANSFDYQYRTLLWIIGKSVNRESGWTPKVLTYTEILRRWGADPNVNKATKDGPKPSLITIRRRVKKLADAGILDLERQMGSYVSHGGHKVYAPRAFDGYTFQPDFCKTIQLGVVDDFDWERPLMDPNYATQQRYNVAA